MQELATPVPELVDVVPADQADELVRATRESLAALSHQASEVAQAADAAEREAKAMGADPVMLGRATEAAQRFIDEQRDRTDAELRTILDDASARSRRRIDEARADAERIRADARRLAAAATTVDVAAPAAALPGLPLWIEVADAGGAAADEVEVAVPEVADAGGAAVDEVEAAAVESAAVVVPAVEPSGGDGVGRGSDTTASIAAPKAVWPPVEPPPWTLDSAPEPAAAPETASAAEAATPAEPAASRLGSVPVYALLQVAALVVVLVVLLAFVN